MPHCDTHVRRPLCHPRVPLLGSPCLGHDGDMSGPFAGRVLPANQRKDLVELKEQLDLTYGDAQSKQSAYWTMLVLSAVIASAGVIGDSTATVIGAMIIAPLATPIMGIGLALSTGSSRLLGRSLLFVACGAVVVVGIGFLVSLFMPDATNVLTNSQITSRTSPRLVDLLAAMATGMAGAVGLARRDVGDILPGVAIAISLVPPLAVVGICLESGQVALAVGALVLFLSNLIAMVLCGTIVYTAYGYAKEARILNGISRRRAYTAIGIGFVLVFIPLAANTLGHAFISIWTTNATAAADDWAARTPGTTVDSVEVTANTVTVSVRAPSALPDLQGLLDSLDGQVPNGMNVVVVSTEGERVEAGSVGD